MFRKALMIIFINNCLVYSLWAQNSLSTQMTNAKFQVIKATTEFLASDKSTFTKVKEESCPSCKSYSDLTKFVERNKMTGVVGFINHWRSIKVDTTPQHAKASLNALTKRITDTLFTDGQKSKRESLVGYKRFLDVLKMKKEAIRTDKAAMRPQQAVKSKGVSENISKDSSALADQKSMEPEANTTGDTLWLSSKYVVFGEAVVIILLAFFLALKIMDNKKNLRKKEKEFLKNSEEIDKQLIWEQDKVLRLEGEVRELKRSNDELEAISGRQNKVQVSLTETVIASLVPIITAPVIPVTPPTVVKYARYADTGDGFSSAELLTQEDNETIFEITILTTLNAEYRVTKNIAAQKYALANANYFLSKSCKYDTSPLGTIITDSPGTLRLQGSKWQITEPAQISFKSS